MIKIATIDDLELVQKHCLDFCAVIKQADMVNLDKVKGMIYSFLTAPKEEKICLLHGEEGMLGGFIQPYLLGLVPTATEIAWWVTPEARNKNVGRELVEAFEYWAKKLNCKYTIMSCYADHDVGLFYESIGYTLHEKAYIKDLS